MRFWRAGVPDRVFTGYTTNISLSGCFIQTEQPIGTAGRIQMELTSDDQGFVCEGLVARSIKAPYELRQVKPSGMGVRFLGIDELLRSLIPGTLDSSTSANEALRGLDSPSAGIAVGGLKEPADSAATPAAPSGESQGAESGAASTAQPSAKAAARASRRAARRHPAAPPRKPSKAPASTTSDSFTPDLAFRIAPPSIERLAVMYQTELRENQLFIPTTRNAESGATVRVELVLPVAGQTQEQTQKQGEPAKSVDLFGSVLKQWRANSPGEAPGRQPGQQGLSLRLLPATSAMETISSLVASVDLPQHT